MVREHLWGLCDEMCESACVGGDEMCESACVGGLRWDVRERLWGGATGCVFFGSREKKLRFKPQEFTDGFGSD